MTTEARGLAILVCSPTPETPELCVTPLIHAAAACALDCEVELYRAGRMPLAQFAAMPYDRDILTRICLRKTPGLKVQYQSVRATQTDFPILTCAAARTAQGQYRFAIGARPMKAVLVTPDCDPAQLPAAVQAAVKTGSNLRGSAAYRTHLVGVLVKRAVQALGNLEVL